MALDHELPVWSVAPNWQQSVLETLEWKTDVLTSLSGVEQRIASRLSPRRMIEARYNPHKNERTFVDLAMQRLGRTEWMMPLWFDFSELTSQAVIGGSRIDCSTQYHEFIDGGMAYLVGPNAFTGEAVRIEAVDGTGFSLVAPLGATWPAGTRIYPMRRGRFEPPSQSLIVSALSEVSLRFTSVEGNTIPSEGAWALNHAGSPVMDRTPEWSQNQEIDLSFLGETFDPGLGRLRVTDTAGRAFRTQQFASILHGPKEHYEYRQMLYRLRGQQTGIWLPTYADDLTVSASKGIGVTQIDVEQCGLAYVGGPADGRDHIRLPNGQIVKITAASLPGGGIERLTLETATTGTLTPGDKIEFIEKVRLAQDSIEIEHLGDNNGASRSTLSFKAFADKRVPATAIQAHPPASMSDDQCGDPAGGSCAIWTPPEPGFPCEFFGKLRVEWINPSVSKPRNGFYGRVFGAGTQVDESDTIVCQYPGWTVVENFAAITLYFLDPRVADPGGELDLRLQFASGSVASNMRARAYWNDALILPKLQSESFFPGDPSFSLAAPDGSFDVRGLWPDNWYFDV